MTEREISILAFDLMAEHGLLVEGWAFRFEDTLPATDGTDLAGHCSWMERRIRLARKYALNYDETRVRRVLLHEIAHALVGVENAGHGEVFQAKLAEVADAAVV